MVYYNSLVKDLTEGVKWLDQLLAERGITPQQYLEVYPLIIGVK